ncbi:hypothetical protein QBC38DRAFT_532077 [Podospora fimiseda]|uniref:non-specific serine/threonine protein kinase n=1 Tax=Podospora fimiseda TaxID=252190 RepID=A0AAN7BKF3_9PEZI|nr:hypothetical protein QBC38DRAFT_532077 [Podospora fimiseda]
MEEGRSEYHAGGFHPVYIGNVYGKKYEVLQKLGYDLDQETNDGTEYYAMKVLSAMCYGTEYDIFELEILKHLRAGDKEHGGYRRVLHLINDFTLDGPNGNHSMIPEPVALRAPEVLIKAPWDKNVDWWNYGAIFLELFRAIRMFSGRVPPDGHYEVKKHISEIVTLFGSFPKSLLEKGDKDLIFDDQGKVKGLPECRRPPLDDEAWTPGLCKDAREECVSFLRLVMKADPEERPGLFDILGHVWLDAIPTNESSDK